MTKAKYTLGVACNDGLAKYPYLMTNGKPIEADSFEEARIKFLADPSVQSAKANDIVMIISTGYELHE